MLFLADDLGWSDLACYGSDFMRRRILTGSRVRGMKFTQDYAACTVCSPTRSALMTGKYPAPVKGKKKKPVSRLRQSSC